VFAVVYLDNILIYSQKEEDHVEHVTKVLQKLQEAGLFVNGQKSDFHTTSTTYLGFIVTPEGISMDPQKVQAISDWEPPKNVHDVQIFLGFANFYRRFIDKYATKCRPKYDLLKKDVSFKWTKEQQQILENLKEAFTTAPILRHYNPSLQAIVECDASNTVVGGILSNTSLKMENKFYTQLPISPRKCHTPNVTTASETRNSLLSYEASRSGITSWKARKNPFSYTQTIETYQNSGPRKPSPAEKSDGQLSFPNTILRFSIDLDLRTQKLIC
jgi:hypothetical protein